MKATTRSKIERTFSKRYREAHQFQKGSEGLRDFAQMLPMVRQLSRKEASEFLVPMLDTLIFFTEHCSNCQAKLLVFAEFFCIDTCASKSVEYLQKYEELMADRERSHATKREYRLEVYQAIERYQEQGRHG